MYGKLDKSGLFSNMADFHGRRHLAFLIHLLIGPIFQAAILDLENSRICPVFHTFLCKYFTFLNACISVKTSPINTKLGDFFKLMNADMVKHTCS